jgi:catechol 2,3-dioxygenase-like lactoylglutathione lyase family enzyme
VSTTLVSAVPTLPSADLDRSLEFYRDLLGFEVVHRDDGFAVLRRDTVTLNLWGATDEAWRASLDADKPVSSGTESFIAGTASCRIAVTGIEELFAACRAHEIVHPNGALAERPWGAREFTVLDPDGNGVTFFQ